MIYEVDINSDFNFNNKLCLNQIEFRNLAKKNNVDLSKIQLSENEPLWRLFEIQLSQYSNGVYLKTDRSKEKFKDFIKYFNIVTQVIHKELDIMDINFKKLEYEYYFKFLINIHYEFKNYQQFKLMWNLESTYISTTIDIFLKYNISYSELEKLTRHNQTNYLYTIYKGNDKEYFLSESLYFKKTDVLELFQVEYDLSEDKCLDLLFSNEEYYSTMHTIIEINERYKQKKYNPHVLLSLVRGIVLNIEELIKNSINVNILLLHKKNIKLIKSDIKKNNKKRKNCKTLKKCLNNRCDLFIYLKLLSNIDKFKGIREKVIKFEKNYFQQMKFLSRIDCKEKYLHTFHLTRNYIAHNHLDFNELFSDYAKKTSLILDSVIFIMVYLEYLKSKK